MAIVDVNPDIPLNIFTIPSTNPKKIRRYFERGDVVLIPDMKIDADFDYLASVPPPSGTGARRDKYVFWRMINARRDERLPIWQHFKDGSFADDLPAFEKFQNAVRDVDRQLDAIVRKIFNKNTFETETITWKFHRNLGENMHIDNLNGCDKVAQVRLFVNLDSRPRLWSIGRHWRYYAERHYQEDGLSELTGQPAAFNQRLTEKAFGLSTQSCDDPRHLIEFAPGEIWLANSALVAHQVRGGNLLAIAHYEYPYRQYVDRSASLPAQLKALVQSKAPTPASLVDRVCQFAGSRWWSRR